MRSQRGSAEAFARLVDIFEVRLFNFILRKVGSRVEAEDLTQETFLRAWQRIDRYRPRWRFSTWLYTIATRLAISHARRSNSTLRPAARHVEPACAPPEAKQELSWVWRLVDEVLTDEQRAAVWLRYVEDLGISEIATVMSKSQVGVRVMLFRARAALAERMRDMEPDELELSVSTVAVGQPIAGGVA